MARRNRTEDSTTISTDDTNLEASTEAAATEPEENSTMSTATETTPEAPAERVDYDGNLLPGVEAEAKAPVESPAPVDLTEFTASMTAAVAGRDGASGDVPEALVTAVQSVYRGLDGLRAKNAAKKLVEEAMREAMNQRDVLSARAFMLVSDNLTAGASAKAEKVPADPKAAFVQRYSALLLALELVSRDAPEGVTVSEIDVTSEINSALALRAFDSSDAEDKGDAPEASSVVKAAVKIATGKAARVGGKSTGGSTFTGERRDIGKHIDSAFEGEEVGTFLTVAQIRSHKSDEYGDNLPSAGAISARLFPASGKCSIENVEPGQNENSNKGATKLA